MHELSITENILALALQKAEEVQATRIKKINLVVGELSGVVDGCVRFYFKMISKDNIANGAELTFEFKPTIVRCRSCQVNYSPTGGVWNCPQCKQTDIDIVSGRECYMTSIEVE
ncbi:MAG: hydrogenase maturation nickel metallochaperone HypA [Dehalococcoidales bacterium]|nr:hydrogenase maturation nickel metallochaperone HypA [Dehalococcoidales bacterium]